MRVSEATERRLPFLAGERGAIQRETARRETTLPPNVFCGATLLAGNANVIMQLAHPAVGRGVVESTVTSGQLSRHPVKRTRTTLTYLAVSLAGSDEERRLFRKAVGRQHAHVRSGESSPVRYNAFDGDLQLWVAACLYKGLEDSRAALGLPLGRSCTDVMYRHAARLGSTLQMPESAWPEDRAAFEQYWKQQLERVSIDPEVREHLRHITELGFLPAPLRRVFGPVNRFVTTGFLPPRFREEMGLPWGPRQQRRFDRLMGGIGAVARRSPRQLREFPYNLVLRDLRRRIRRNQPLA